MTRSATMTGLSALALAATAAPALAASYTESFDTDAADVTAFQAAYPDIAVTGANVAVTGGVITAGANEQPEFVVTSADAGFGADFGSHYTVSGDIGGTGGTALNYSPTLMISGNLGIEFGVSAGGNEFFRVIARDFPTSTASVTGIPVQIADIGFDILDGDLYHVEATILRNGDGTVQLDVTVDDANSAAVYTMATQVFSASDATALFGSYSQAGFRKRGGDGQLLADNLAINTVPEPGSLALLALGGLIALRRRRA